MLSQKEKYTMFARRTSRRPEAVILGLGLAALLGLAACAPAVPAGDGVTVNTSLQPTGISVAGEGKLTVVPDVALLQLGVEARAQTVKQASQEATQAMEAVVAELKANGIEEKDIRKVYFNIQPIRSFRDEEETITGYRVSNNVTAKIREIDRTGEIIDKVVSAGGDLIRINGITLTLDDPTELQAQLRDLALADAKTKAEQIARLSGAQLGK